MLITLFCLAVESFIDREELCSFEIRGEIIGSLRLLIVLGVFFAQYALQINVV